MNLDNTNLLFLIFKWKKTLLIVFSVSVFFSIIFTGPTFIKPLYKSSSTLYPVNILSYSDESPTEQMVQLLYSKELHKQVIEDFNLLSYYNIDSTDKLAEVKGLQKFEKRFKVKRTQYESVEIEMLDHDPEFAYDLLRHILKTYNEFALSLVKARAKEIYIINRDLYYTKQQQVDSLKNHIQQLIVENNLYEHNILKETMRGASQTLTSMDASNTKLRSALSSASLDIFSNQVILEADIEYLAELKFEYIKSLVDLNKELEFANTISYPDISYKKVYPIRWLIVLLLSGTTMFFTLMLIVLTEKKHQYNVM
jgi:hypothetical protein